MISEGWLKGFLDSVVGPKDRNFTVVFSNNRAKRKLGRYDIADCVIRVNLRHKRLRRKNRRRAIIGVGVHELAHHICWNLAVRRRLNEKSARYHGHNYWIIVGMLMERVRQHKGVTLDGDDVA